VSRDGGGGDIEHVACVVHEAGVGAVRHSCRVPFDELQAQQIEIFRTAWPDAGWEREPRVSVNRSVIPIVSDLDRRLFASRAADSQDQIGYLEGVVARFGRSYTGEPDVIARSSAASRPSARPTRCCSPCPTSSASTTTGGCSRPSPST
jgi:hypothetical protein